MSFDDSLSTASMGLLGVGPKEIIVVGLDLGVGRGKRCCGCHCSSVCQPGYLRSKKEVDGHDWILIVGNDAAKRRGCERRGKCPRSCVLIALLMPPVLRQLRCYNFVVPPLRSQEQLFNALMFMCIANSKSLVTVLFPNPDDGIKQNTIAAA